MLQQIKNQNLAATVSRVYKYFVETFPDKIKNKSERGSQSTAAWTILRCFPEGSTGSDRENFESSETKFATKV